MPPVTVEEKQALLHLMISNLLTSMEIMMPTLISMTEAFPEERCRLGASIRSLMETGEKALVVLKPECPNWVPSSSSAQDPQGGLQVLREVAVRPVTLMVDILTGNAVEKQSVMKLNLQLVVDMLTIKADKNQSVIKWYM